MFKVFLVEDEIVVRESIRDHLPWDQTEFMLVGEAADGEIALPLIEETRPDILITDIKMPFMDGLELSRIVKRNQPWIKIIIISGYDEFSFAKEAINIAVTDYLLKPLSSQDLLATLDRVAGQIEEEALRRAELENLSRCVKDSRQVIAERFLSDLSTGIVPSGEAIEKAENLGVDLISRFFVVAVVASSIRQKISLHQEYNEYIKSENLIDELLEVNTDVLKFTHNLKEIVLIFKGDDAEQVEQTCFSACQSLKYEVERRTSCSLSIDIGSVRERIQGIAESFRDAQTASRFNYIFGKNKIVGIKDTERAKFNSGSILALDISTFAEALKTGERAAIEKILTDHIDKVYAMNIGRMYRHFAVIELALALAKFVTELGGDVNELLSELENLDTILEGTDSSELKKYLLQILQRAHEFREKCKSNKYGDLISKAKKFIEDNFSDSEMSLVAVARTVNVSPSHFSTIFSQETGQTFIEFLTETRIRKAKEYLKTSSLRSSEIAYKVGYKDPHYFSYIFKSSTGSTPTGFRQNKG